MKPPKLRDTVLSQSRCGFVKRMKLELVAERIVEDLPYEDLIEYAMELFRSDLEETDGEEIEQQFQELFAGEVENYPTQIEMLMEYQAELLSPGDLAEHAISCAILDSAHLSEEELDYIIKRDGIT